jgi:hypothetical protein
MHLRHLAISAALLLAACSPDHRQADIGKCIAQSEAALPQGAGVNNEEAHDEVGAMVIDCMKAMGYRHDMADGRCVDDVDFGPYCYVQRR